MEKNKKILGLISLVAKSGKICFGTDNVEEQVKKKKVYLVIVAMDASDRTKEKFKKLSDEYNVPITIISDIQSLSKTIGKSNKAIIGIAEQNLAKEILKINNGGEIIG